MHCPDYSTVKFRLTLSLPVVYLLFLCSCANVPQLAAGESTNRIGIPPEVSITKGVGHGDMICLNVLLNEREEFLFLLETGWAFTAVDQSLAPKLGSPIGTVIVEDGFVGKEMPKTRYEAPPLFLGKTRLQTGGWVMTHDLSIFREALGRPIMGILGIDCLKHYCIQLDFNSGKLRFFDPDQPGDEGLGKAFLLTATDDGRYTVRENLLGVEGVNSFIDTGFNSTGTLAPQLFARGALDPKFAVAGTQMASLSGVGEYREGRFPKCEFGGETYTNLVLSEGRTTVIGLRFLARHLVTFNFPKSKIYLKRRAGEFPSDEARMSGLSIRRKDDAILVYSVDRGGPADREGVRENDVVLKINDLPANALEFWELRNMLRAGDGKEVRLTVERDGEQKQFIIILKRRI
jgi:hypothetical protein